MKDSGAQKKNLNKKTQRRRECLGLHSTREGLSWAVLVPLFPCKLPCVLMFPQFFLLCSPLSLRKDDGNGNDDARKQSLIGWMRKNNHAARAARSLEQFFDIVCQMTTWNFQIKVLTSTRTHNSKFFILYIYFNGASTSSFAYSVLCQ